MIKYYYSHMFTGRIITGIGGKRDFKTGIYTEEVLDVPKEMLLTANIFITEDAEIEENVRTLLKSDKSMVYEEKVRKYVNEIAENYELLELPEVVETERKYRSLLYRQNESQNQMLANINGMIKSVDIYGVRDLDVLESYLNNIEGSVKYIKEQIVKRRDLLKEKE